MGPGVLSNLLSQLPRPSDTRLMVGFESSDDAAVYLLDEHNVLIQTVDFFPPMVDDPFVFGQVAAANALSDVYAMGGAPKLAMNLLCLPHDLPTEAARAILAGGLDKVTEAGAIIAGGHSIEDKEPKYGLCVTGFARREEIVTNRGAGPGDVLILTKPLGVGVLTTAARGGLLNGSRLRAVTTAMTTLNRAACEAMLPCRPSACTDVTGFGLLGHLWEMLPPCGGLSAVLSAGAIPLLPGALALAADGILPGGAHRNRAHLGSHVQFDRAVSLPLSDLLFDPQTSGGLLIAVPPDRAEALMQRLIDRDVSAAVIGGFRAAAEAGIQVEP